MSLLFWDDSIDLGISSLRRFQSRTTEINAPSRLNHPTQFESGSPTFIISTEKLSELHLGFRTAMTRYRGLRRSRVSFTPHPTLHRDVCIVHRSKLATTRSMIQMKVSIRSTTYSPLCEKGSMVIRSTLNHPCRRESPPVNDFFRCGHVRRFYP